MIQRGTATSGAWFSEDGRYRYLLWRQLERDLASPGAGTLLWCGLNPSTADERLNDPTCRREIAFTRRLGFARYLKWNLFGYRATKPRVLRTIRRWELPGDENIHALTLALGEAEQVIAAWGADPAIEEHDQDRLAYAIMAEHPRIGPTKIGCLAVTAEGFPGHPLYLRSDAPLQCYSPPWPLRTIVRVRPRVPIGLFHVEVP